MVENTSKFNLKSFLQSQYTVVDSTVMQMAVKFIITHVPVSTLESITYPQRVALISLVYYYIYNDTLGSVANLLANLFDLCSQGEYKKVSLKILLFAQSTTTVDIKVFRLRKNEQQLFDRGY